MAEYIDIYPDWNDIKCGDVILGNFLGPLKYPWVVAAVTNDPQGYINHVRVISKLGWPYEWSNIYDKDHWNRCNPHHDT